MSEEYPATSTAIPAMPRLARTRRLSVRFAVLALVAVGLTVPHGSLPPAHASITTNEVVPVPPGGVFTVAGHGWGHGHGMSQWGAAGAAAKGLSYSQIVSFYYPNTAAGNIGNPTIKVFLDSMYALNDNNIHIADPGTLTIYDEASGKHYSYASTATWRVVMSGGKFLVQYATSVWNTKLTLTGPLHIDPVATNHITYPLDKTYTGWLRLVPTGSSSFRTIENASMQNYLGGVVPSESISSWPAAALQAQAVAARSYAAYQMHHPRSSVYDVYDTTADQVFNGQGVRVASTDAAVAATSGYVRTYGGEPILAQFSSSNGGWSTDGGEPYLTAHADPYDGVLPNSVHSWSATLPASALQARYPQIGTLKQIDITERDGNGAWGGRVYDAVLVGSAGSVTVSGLDIYEAYSWPSHSTGLRSTWFDFTPATADVTGDHVSDLVTGVPGLTVDGQAGAGAVAFVPGRAGSLGTAGSVLTQDTSGVPGASEAGDGFGTSAATGDFNGDGHADAAVGVPGEDLGTIANAGTVDILPGTSSGLTGSGSIGITEDDVPGTAAAAGDEFGDSVVTGDFNHDGYADLVVGAPGRTVDGAVGAGTITFIPGSSTGLQPSRAVTFSQDSTDVPGTSEAGDHFGAALAAGDINGDGYTDLVVGVPGEEIGTDPSGMIEVFMGSSTGLKPTTVALAGDSVGNAPDFGRALAVGDVNRDGRADVAVGGDGPDNSGGVTVVLGTSSGLTGSHVTITQNTAGVPGVDETGDSFGAALAMGDLNGDGYADIAVGNPTEAVGTLADAGDVTALYGSAAGITGSGAQTFTQDTADVSGAAQAGDRMGASVAIEDLNGDRIGDLVVGVPGNAAGGAGAGSINVLYGSAAKVTTSGNLSAYLPVTSLGAGATKDNFGFSLAQ